MRPVPRKNIYPVLSDIKSPEKKIKPLVSKKALVNISRLDYSISFVSITLFLVTGLLFGFYVFKVSELKQNASQVVSKFQVSVSEIKEYIKSREFKEAAEEIGTLNNDINNIGNEAENFGLFQISNLLGTFWNTAKNLPRTLLGIQEVGRLVFEVVSELDFLESNAMQLIFNKRGAELLSSLRGIESKIEQIDSAGQSLNNEFSKLEKSKLAPGNLNSVFLNSYLENATSFYEVQDFLKNLINFLDQPNDINILLMFQNSSEMRPSGGFLGSLANIIINKGSLDRFEVQDIYDLDGQLDLKVIPPKVLQGITTDWGARDANWFFDFEKSAQKVRYFLENSKIYKERNLKFPAVFSINDEVLKSILSLTGSINIPDYKLAIDQFNFLPLIQEEVEAGKDKYAGHPKRILKVLTPVLLEKIKNFNGDEKKKLLGNIEFHLKNKDIMAYFDDRGLEDFMKKYGWAGDVYKSENYQSDYLAVVNANIAGGKSDILVSQEIDFISELTLDGDLKNNLIIKRHHDGDSRKESWYRATNQNFIKIFTPKGAKLDFIEGNTKKSLSRGIKYSKNYLKDLDLIQIEEGEIIGDSSVWITEEDNKNVFGTWFNVKSGESKTLKLDYTVPRALDIKEGPYKLVFDKQSGVRGSLRIALVAPLGFKWKESGSKYFEYETRNPEARVILEINLEKL